MKTRLIFMALVGAFSLSYLFPADFWDKKPYTEWRQKDCDKLLKKSPWSHPYALTGVNIPAMSTFDGSYTLGRNYGDADLDSQIGDREVHLYLQIRFLTARPVKAAVGRIRMLSDQGNADLARQVDQYVRQPDGPEIIMEITSYSEPEGHPALRKIDGFLRTTTLAALRNRVWLSASSKNANVPILRYQAPHDGSNGALLFFPRYDENGAPYFDGTEKEILFRMEVSIADINLVLKPGDMKFEDSFTF